MAFTRQGFTRARSWLKMKLTGTLYLANEYQSRITTEEEYQKLIQMRDLVQEILLKWDDSSEELGLKIKKNV